MDPSRKLNLIFYGNVNFGNQYFRQIMDCDRCIPVAKVETIR